MLTEWVSQDMHYTKTDNGQQRFKMAEFLTAQQIQGYFSRTATILRHTTAALLVQDPSTDDSDIQVAREEEASLSAHAAILDLKSPSSPPPPPLPPPKESYYHYSIYRNDSI